MTRPTWKSWARYQSRKLFRPQVVTCAGVTLDLGPAANTDYARAVYRESHEQTEREIISQHLESTDSVLELGTGLGLITVLCCRVVGSDRVWTYEANRSLEPVLQRNFRLNDVAPRLVMQPVTAIAGPTLFQVSDRFVQSSCVPSQQIPVRTETVESVALSAVLAAARPTFLIVDTEGGELDLATPGLEFGNVQKICVEMHPQVIGKAGVEQVRSALQAQEFTRCLQSSRGDVDYYAR